MDKSLFSTVTSQIPFVNYNDGNRVQMASSMIRQSQLLTNPELPLIVTQHSFVKGHSFSCQVAKDDGYVKDVFNNVVLVEYKTGEEEIFQLHDFFTTRYRVGQKFKKGDVIVHHLAYDPETELVAFGVNANVVFGTEKSFTYEDAIVLTKTGRKKFEHIIPVKYIEEFFTNNIVVIDPNKIKPGQLIRKGEKILEYRKIASSLLSIANAEVRTLRSDYDFVITRIFTIAKDDFLKLQPDHTKKFFRMYSYDDVDLHPLIKKAMKKGFSFDGQAYIVIEGISRRLPQIGDKFANPYGNKGVVSTFIDDFELIDNQNDIRFVPYVIHTPVGVPSRMNIGQILYMALGYILKYVVPKKLQQMNDLNEQIKFLLKVYSYVAPKQYVENLVSLIKKQDKSTLKQHIKEIIRNGFRIIIPQFTYEMVDKIHKLYVDLGVPFVFSDSRYPSRKLGGGVVYTMILEHLVFKKLKHVSMSDVDTRTLQPLDGQRMGEMEMWTLASHNTLNFLKESLTIRSDDVISKDTVIRNIIRNGKSDMPEVTNSPTFDLFRSYLVLMGFEIDEK